MSNFRSRPVLPEYRSVGDELKLARQEHGLSLSQAARYLNEKESVIRSLESEDYRNLPKGIYGKIAFKRYVVFLGLDPKKILKHFVSERKLAESLIGDDIFLNKTVSRKELLIFPKFLRNIIFGLIISLAFVYLILYLNKVFSPPDLDIYYPPSDLIVSAFNITISGQTEPESTVEINGEQILIDAKGNFSKDVTLKNGLNDIIIRSRQKYGQESQVSRRIIVE
jgi:transcriptional regulator with XRE-family HTH domain